MIDSIRFSFRNGTLISFKKDGVKMGIPYSSVKKIWSSLTINSIEAWRCKVVDNLIVVVIFIAQGQGGVLFIWDTSKSDFVHYSEASYCEDFLIFDSKVITMNFISNYVTPYHIQMWACEYGTKDIRESGKRLYCKNPVRFDDNDFKMRDLGMKCQDNELDIVIGTHVYLYSDNIQHIEDQAPNPDYDFLYEEWDNQFDPGKLAMRGMIT